jgi:hypothetical protein
VALEELDHVVAQRGHRPTASSSSRAVTTGPNFVA